MKKTYKLCCGVILLLIFFSFILEKIKITEYISDKRFVELHDSKVSEENNLDKNNSYINEDFTVSGDFTSHLPLIVIDLNENNIPDEYEYNSATDSFQIKDGVDPYVTADMKIVNNASKVNGIYDEAEVSSKIKIKYRGNTSITYDKKQYSIKLLDDEGNESEKSILGMEPDEDWILNISMSDPSLIRNYIALNICGQVIEETPDVKYCELIVKNGNSYEYKGLYLMMESIKKGEGRVDISSYNPSDNNSSYILRRDRYKDNNMILKTEAALNEQCYGWLEIKYPSEKYMNDKLYNYILNDVDKIEQIIYSDDDNVFNTYGNYIDEDSFVDYFLINEFFMNYDAGNNSTYLYKEVGDKLKIGPFWDFDLAIDNYSDELTNLKSIAFTNRAWFERLIKSDKFTKKLVDRYKELRKDILSNENIEKTIDDTVNYLGNAIERDYLRWKSEYNNLNTEKIQDVNGISVDRSLVSFENEIDRVKDNLYIHSIYMEYCLEDLHEPNNICHDYKSYTGLAIMFIAAFFTSIVVVRRRYS